MKKIFLLLFSCSFLFFSCSDENPSQSRPQNSNVSTYDLSDLNTLKSFSKYVTREIYTHAYDSEIGEVDLEKYDQIILSYQFNDEIDLSTSLKQPLLTRGSGEIYNIIDKSEFTQKQKDVIKELLSLEKPTLEDYQTIKLQVSSWDTEEKNVIIRIVDSIIYISDGIYEGLNDINLVQTRTSAKSYMCNLGVSLISGVTGFLAGALAAPSGPFAGAIGFVVSTGVGTYLGANMC